MLNIKNTREHLIYIKCIKNMMSLRYIICSSLQSNTEGIYMLCFFYENHVYTFSRPNIIICNIPNMCIITYE